MNFKKQYYDLLQYRYLFGDADEFEEDLLIAA